MNKRNDVKKCIADKKCKHCGKHYELGNIESVGHTEDLLFFTAYCPSCNNTGLAIVEIIDIKGDKETEAATDLSEAEESCFSIPISSSDVLDMHIFLKDFKGDFVV